MMNGDVLRAYDEAILGLRRVENAFKTAFPKGIPKLRRASPSEMLYTPYKSDELNEAVRAAVKADDMLTDAAIEFKTIVEGPLRERAERLVNATIDRVKETPGWPFAFPDRVGHVRSTRQGFLHAVFVFLQRMKKAKPEAFATIPRNVALRHVESAHETAQTESVDEDESWLQCQKDAWLVCETFQADPDVARMHTFQALKRWLTYAMPTERELIVCLRDQSKQRIGQSDVDHAIEMNPARRDPLVSRIDAFGRDPELTQSALNAQRPHWTVMGYLYIIKHYPDGGDYSLFHLRETDVKGTVFMMVSYLKDDFVRVRYAGYVWEAVQRVLDDLVSWRQEIEKRATDVPIAPPKKVEQRAEESFLTATHSTDFTSVNWFGTRYEFSKGRQADAVRILWEHWEKGGHSVAQATIGEHIESASDRFRLRDVFRRTNDGRIEYHPAWKTMIQPASKGSYRLAPPES